MRGLNKEQRFFNMSLEEKERAYLGKCRFRHNRNNCKYYNLDNMNNFIYQYPVKQYFGRGCTEEAIKTELKTVGNNVLLAYGGGSLKRTGLYDKLRTWLEEMGKNVTDFGGIMPNPTYAKVQEGARIVQEKALISFLLLVADRSLIAAKLFLHKPCLTRIFGICGMLGIACRPNLFRWELS